MCRNKSMFTFCSMFVSATAQRLGYVLESTLMMCTDFSVQLNANPITLINDVKSCLSHANILSIPPTTSLLNATVYYHRAITDYELARTKVSSTDLENRREVRSLQTDVVALIMRLKYFSSAFNIPNFARLSDGRRLALVRKHVENLKDTASFVDSVHPTLDAYQLLLRNLPHDPLLVSHSALVRDSAALYLDNTIVQFRSELRARYV